jgi:hypothetical protein
VVLPVAKAAARSSSEAQNVRESESALIPYKEIKKLILCVMVFVCPDRLHLVCIYNRNIVDYN